MTAAAIYDATPPDALPGVAPISVVLHSDQRVLVAVGPAQVWPSRVLLTLTLLVSPNLTLSRPFAWMGDPQRGDSLMEVAFRLQEDQESAWLAPGPATMDSPLGRGVIRFEGGGGSARETHHLWGLQPLPATGPLEARVRWPELDILSPWTDISLQPLVDALAQVRPADWAAPDSA